MKKIILASLLFLVTHQLLIAQCPSASFSISPALVCAGDSIVITNTSTNASSYLWDFCSYLNFDSSEVTDYGIVGGLLNLNFGVRMVHDGVNWYGFSQNNGGGNHLIRFDFGNNLNNPPVDTSLGPLLGGSIYANLSFMKEGNDWHGFAGTYGAVLYRLDFGASLSNVPTVTTLPSVTGGLYGTDIIKDNGKTFLFLSSYSNRNVTVINFGDTITNANPQQQTIAAADFTGATGLMDVDVMKDCNQWYGIAADYGGAIYKIDFGDSLTNPSPVVVQIGNSGFGSTTRGGIMHTGNSWYYMVFSNNAHGFRIFDFGTSLTNNSPTLLPGVYLNLAGYGNAEAQDFVKSGSDIIAFNIAYSSATIQKISFLHNCPVAVSTDTNQTPAPFLYGMGGDYIISLQATDSAGNVNYASQQFTVSPSPTSDFTFINTCFGDQTVFTDASTNTSGSIVSWLWDFGDSFTDSVLNPVHTYSLPGAYTVSLTTTGGNGCANTKSVVINITPKPDAILNAPASCSETLIQFSDSSTIASGTINGWHWDFGSGDTSNVQHPVYEYPTGGNYIVTLEVTSDGGCTDTTSLSFFIDYRPQSDFEVSNTCIGQNAQFTDLTVAQSTITSYSWDFGDASSDTVDSPSHAFPVVVATYNVILVVNTINGCSDTTIRAIKINNIPTINFSYAPLTVCEGNNATFSDLSTVAGDTISGWQWNFGDFQSDTVQNPVHQYAAPGNYTVVLTAFSPTSCGNSDSIIVNVIQSPTASFTYSSVCLGNATSFTDQSSTPSGSSIVSYFWDFGNTYTDTVQNPAHTFQTSGNHLVTLTVTSNFGCTNTDSLLVFVNPLPVASFVNSSPCTIDSVQFTSTSIIDSASFISTYLWNFGNPATGVNNTSALQNPSHLFDTTGTFVVSLITTSNFGCMDTGYSVLTVQAASRANFQYNPTCYGDLVQFTRLPTPSPLDSTWFWAFGDGQFNQLENPSHFYAVPQTYNVTLTVFSTTGCVSSVTKPVTVSPIPTAAFVHSPACIGSPHQFLDSSYIAAGSIVAWKWNFGQTDSSFLQNPVFTFPATGSDTITLKVTSDIGCTNTMTRIIQVYPLPVANFSFNPQYGNPPLNVSFTNLTTGGSTYEWNFGDGSTSFLINPQHLFTDTSLYPIQLIATSQYGCKDSIVKSIYVIKPTLDLAITGVSSNVQNNLLQITVDLANLGTRPINDFKMEARLEGGTTIIETYVQSLPNGYSGQQTFFSKLDLGSGQAKYYCIRALEPNGSPDDVPSNDELCKSLTKEFSVVNPFPNPFSDHLALQLILPYKDQLSIDLFDMAGKQISLYEGEGKEGSNLFQADLGHLADGTYAVRFKFRESQVIKTIVKTDKKK